jgi:hypothetical protein
VRWTIIELRNDDGKKTTKKKTKKTIKTKKTKTTTTKKRQIHCCS